MNRGDYIRVEFMANPFQHPVAADEQFLVTALIRPAAEGVAKKVQIV